MKDKTKYGVTSGIAILLGGLVANHLLVPGIAIAAGVLGFSGIVIAHILAHAANDRASMVAGLQKAK